MTGKNGRRVGARIPTAINPAGMLTMTVPSMGRVLVPVLALVAAGGAAAVFGITHAWREPPSETTTAAAAAVPLVSPAATPAQAESPAALAKAKTEAGAVAAELAVPPLPATADESLPAFDVARIEPTGEAVIAGRAAPGATVELLRDGERLEQAAADQSGQFVMVPPPLPPGNYELTLRSRLPDGTLATSKHGVAVALNEAPSSTGALSSRAEAAGGSGSAAANRPDVAASQPPRTTVATAAPDGGSLSAAVEPKVESRAEAKGEPKSVTTVVSRGDSLWRISRLTYGVGTRYAIVYRANRERIRDPNRIYPGQVFVLPERTR
jgi:nucleoid-associated protein YgaU